MPKPSAALFFGQEVCHHGVRGRAANVGEEADTHRERIEGGERIRQSQRKSAEGAEDQAEQDQPPPPELVGQRAADHAPDQPEGREHSKDDPGLGHADVEFLGDVEREEWEEQGPADAVNEGYQHHDPELARVFMIDLGEFGEHESDYIL